MKAKKLIEKLKLLPPDMEVYVPQGDKDFTIYQRAKSAEIDELSDLDTDDNEVVVILIN